MAKPASIKIKLESTAGTGYFYVTKKNSRTQTEKMVIKKYDPIARKHVEFKETQIKGVGCGPDVRALQRKRAGPYRTGSFRLKWWPAGQSRLIRGGHSMNHAPAGRASRTQEMRRT